MHRQDAFIVELTSSVPPVSVTTTAIPPGRASVAYGTTLAAAGGQNVYTWSISAGTLPSGMALDASGVLSGTPAAAGDYSFTVTAADASNTQNAARAALSMHVGFAPLAISVQGLPNGRLTVGYSASPQESGGSGACVWSVAAGSLPPGVALDAASGAISGMPITVGAFAFTIVVTGAADAANSASGSGSIAVGVAPVVVTTNSLPSGRERVSYKASLSASGGTGSVTWSAASGALPGGLVLNGATGQITGTPTLAGTYSIALRATDVADPSNVSVVPLSLVVAAGVSVASPRGIPVASVNVPYAYQMLAANVVGTTKWNLQGG